MNKKSSVDSTFVSYQAIAAILLLIVLPTAGLLISTVVQYFTKQTFYSNAAFFIFTCLISTIVRLSLKSPTRGSQRQFKEIFQYVCLAGLIGLIWVMVAGILLIVSVKISNDYNNLLGGGLVYFYFAPTIFLSGVVFSIIGIPMDSIKKKK